MKVCFAASSGGHYEQILMLKPLMEKYDSFVITEKMPYKVEPEHVRTYFLSQVNRREKGFFIRMVLNSFRSLFIFIKEKPDVVVSTGVLAMIPICLMAKFFRRKFVFIESFAKVTSPTETGKFLYRYADRFYVQWESMLIEYPEAACVGGIY